MNGAELSASERRLLEGIRRWAVLLDSAFRVPGTPFRVGIDAIIGLVPGLGDAASAIVSVFLVVQASRLGLSRVVLLRMIVNIVIDTVVGMVPLVGDLFDAGWKANLRNLALLDRQIARGRVGPTTGDVLFLSAIVAVVVLAVVVPIVLLYLFLRLLHRPVL